MTTKAKGMVLAVLANVAGLSTWGEAITLDTEALGGLGGVESSGELSVGETVTFTAATREGAAFVRWVGTIVPEGQETANPLTLTVTDAMEGGVLRPLYDDMWLIDDSGDETLLTGADGNWSFCISELDQSAHTFAFAVHSSDFPQTTYRSGSGELDLSTPMCDASGTPWTSIKAYGRAFSFCVGITKFIAPTTWTTMTGYVLRNADDPMKEDGKNAASDVTTLDEVIIDCPSLTGSLDENVFANIQPTKFTLKVPKVTKLTTMTFPVRRAYAKSDATEWDLSSVETIDWAWGTPDSSISENNYGFSDKSFTGVLRLPRIKSLPQKAFGGTSSLSAIELGLDGGTIESLGSDLVGYARYANNASGISSITLAGASTGWTVDAGALTLTNKLDAVYIVSNPPTITDGGTLCDGFDKGEKTAAFFVPRLSGWSDILASATPVAEDDAQLVAYKAAHRDCPEIIGTVDATVFGTENAQFIGVLKRTDYGLGTKLTLTVNDQKGDAIVGAEAGIYDSDETITLRAVPGEGRTFVEWQGLPEGVEQASEVTFTLGEVDLAITLVTLGEGEEGPTQWTYHPGSWTFNGTEMAGSQITDGNWVLNVFRPDESRNVLTLGKATSAGGGKVFTEFGEGALDFRLPVYDEEGTVWTIVAVKEYAFYDYDSQYGAVTDLYLPTTLESLGVYAFRNQGSLTNVWLSAPNLTGELPMRLFYQCPIEKAVIVTPQATGIGDEAFYTSKVFYNQTDYGTWDLGSVTAVGAKALSGCSAAGGSLVLPKLETFGTSAHESNWSSKVMDAQFTNIVFGTAYTRRDAKAFSIGASAFLKNYNLKAATFGPYASFETADGSAFNTCANLRQINFLGAPPAAAFLDDLVQSGTAVASVSSADKAIVIRGSKKLGWADIASEPTDAELAKAPTLAEGEKILGVYVTAAGTRIAWIVHEASPYDPTGLTIIVR